MKPDNGLDARPGHRGVGDPGQAASTDVAGWSSVRKAWAPAASARSDPGRAPGSG